MDTTFADLAPAQAARLAADGRLTLVDVRPPQERAIAAVAVAHAGLEDGGLERLLALPRDRPLAFLCHHGARSAQAAQYFAAQGFTETYNVVGGIEAWSATVDATVPHY